MERRMIKKYALFGILGLTAILALSAFNSVAYQPEKNLALRPVEPEFPTPKKCNIIDIQTVDETVSLGDHVSTPVPDLLANNFRYLQYWNGYYNIPSMNITGLLVDPFKANLPNLQVNIFRFHQELNYC
jgi:hypothetical protein